MSTAAIYEVTRALRVLLYSQLVDVSSSAVVTLLPPGDTLPLTSGVNLYLYRVLESPFTKNQAWPGDRSTAASNLPALGLQLYYLLTPLGVRPDETSFTLGDDAHTMLGAAMATLHANPVLNNTHIPGFDADTVLPSFLLDSFEQIKIMLAPAGIEELSKIWATINQPYRLSVAYEVSLVEISPDAPPPVSAGFVTVAPMAQVIAWQAAQLTALTPPQGALVRVDGAGNVSGNTVLISGAGLTMAGQPPSVTVGGQSVVVAASTPAPDETLTAGLPDSLDAGPQANIVVAVAGLASVPQSFVVDPWLSGVTPIRTALDPATPGDLTLTLTGQGFTAAPAAVWLQGEAAPLLLTGLLPGGTDQRAVVTLPNTLVNGIYQIRVVLADAVGSATNARAFQVVPFLATPVALATPTVDGRQVHQLTITGARLAGADLRLLIDGIMYQAGANADATQIVFILGRLLTPGQHTLGIVLDGQSSRIIGLTV